MSERIFRVAVLSDLHFGSAKQEKDHTFVIAGEPAVPRQHPFEDLRRLIEAEGISANVVVCPGDITLQAGRIGLQHAWEALNQLTADLQAEHLLVATGNHDISSRLKDDAPTPGKERLDESPEIWERLKQLDPKYPYPQGTRVQRLEYWAEHFFTADIGGVRFVVLNSCNSHSRGPGEFERGRVTDYTIERLNEAIRTRPYPTLNVLVCHHHPARQPDLSQLDADYSEMAQGRALLRALEESEQPWLVIHGHKHNPRIEYAQGESGDAPVIFSAGSFSAVLSPRYFPDGRNQFYVIELDLEYVHRNGIAGVIHAWDWASGKGWFRSARNVARARVPSGAGFGHRYNARDAHLIGQHFTGAERVDWLDVRKQFDFLKYITPEDLKRLLARLDRDHGLEAKWAGDEIFPSELLRRVP